MQVNIERLIIIHERRVRRRARTRDDGTRHSRSRSIGCTHDGRNDGRMNETDPPSDYTALITPRSALSRPGRVISGWMVGKGREGKMLQREFF